MQRWAKRGHQILLPHIAIVPNAPLDWTTKAQKTSFLMQKIGLFIAPLATLLFVGVACGATVGPYTPSAGNLEPSNIKTSTSPGWISKCASEARKSPLVCSVEEAIVLVNTGQLVASVAVRMQSEMRELVMTIHVPVGLYLPAGVSFQIDDGKAQPVTLQTCDLQGCVAETEIGATVLMALKTGKRLSIICQNLAKDKIILPLPLDSFAEAFQKIQ